MGIYAYCVVPAGQFPPADLAGIGGARVEPANVAGLSLWVSSGERPEPALDAVLAHNRVVEVAVSEAVTPVPLRFGQWLEDAERLEQAIGENAAHYRELLARFAGCLEFGLRVIDPNAPEEAQEVRNAARTGREYMQALQESGKLADRNRAQAERVAARIREQLRDVVRDERIDTARTTHAVVTMSHLVARENFDEYRERARRLRAAFPELRLLLSGPWPPYSFAA